MTRMLVLGGTGWLGRQIVTEAVAGGADVTCVARGESGKVPAGARLLRTDRRDPGAYAQLEGEWDEVVELAHEPALVVPALEALADRAAHWTLVSTVSVYARNDEPGADENAALAEPVDLERYPDAKVAAERATAARLGDRLTIARPGLIVGPGDPSDRFGYWPARLHRGGRVLIPSPEHRFVQLIDVADLAAWIVHAGRDRHVGVVNAVGETHTMAELLEVTAAVTGFEGELVVADDATLLAQDVAYWAGPRSLPLWVPATESGFFRRSGEAFERSGGTRRPLGETIARTLADELERGLTRPRRAGLDPVEEAAIIEAVA